MKEEILHYWWQRTVHKGTTFTTIDGQALEVLTPGVLNTNQGPDFWNAEILIGGIKLFGNIEMHLKSSDWYAHKHDSDPIYDTVILHVVAESNAQVKVKSKALLEIAVGEFFNEQTINEVEAYLKNSDKLPCKENWKNLNGLERMLFLEGKFVQRLEQKSAEILLLYDKHKGEWQKVFHELLFHYIGGKINREPMLRLHEAFSLNVAYKAIRSEEELDTRLLQLAGFLPLDQGGKHFMNKHHLEPLNRDLWFKHRMYPRNHPEVRLSQLAIIIQRIYPVQMRWFSLDNWQSDFGFSRDERLQELPKNLRVYLDINVFLPMLYSKAILVNDKQKSRHILEAYEKLPMEQNGVVKKFKDLLPQKRCAIDSQALIYLYQTECKTKKCLSCKLSNIKTIDEAIPKNITVLRT